MLLDGLNLVEGSTATNLVLASGTTNPSNPNVGELFYRSDSQAIVVYNGSAWVEVAGGGGGGSGTVTSVNATSTDITVSGGPITTTGSLTLSLNNSGVAAGTYTKVTVDAKGRVTSATTLTAADIPSLADTYMLKTGDTVTGTTTVTNLVLTGPAELKSYTESYFSVTGASTTNIDVSSGSMVLLTLSSSINTLTFSNVPSAPKVASLNMFIEQAGGGSKTITWPNAVKWANAAAPTLSTTATRVDVVTLVTYNSGTSWFGFISGQNYA